MTGRAPRSTLRALHPTLPSMPVESMISIVAPLDGAGDTGDAVEAFVDETVAVVMGKFALVAPAGIVTVAGTEATPKSVES